MSTPLTSAFDFSIFLICVFVNRQQAMCCVYARACLVLVLSLVVYSTFIQKFIVLQRGYDHARRLNKMK